MFHRMAAFLYLKSGCPEALEVALVLVRFDHVARGHRKGESQLCALSGKALHEN